MKIYFVRHGHPDYKNDCLTELGHKQAEAAAERLKDSGIERIFSSSKGRALQTAEHTAKRLGLEVISCDFMREIGWGSIDDESILANGHPWKVADIHVSEGKSLFDSDWRTNDPYCRSQVIECVETVTRGLDAWLEELGYKREGEYYRVTGEDTEKTVAMFSHGGASSAAFSHMFNIPFPQFCGAFRIDFTSITVVQLSNKTGELIYPQILLFNDARHIEGIVGKNVYGN